MDDAAALEEQKSNCIFCKIVKGDIPSKKVFEDDKVLAILDINPAKKGHVIVLPKEHYPILPLIPFPEMQYFFKKTHGVMVAMKRALLCDDVSLFIANGGAAGQMSPHFILHLIPREKNDFFTGIVLPSTGDKAANDALKDSLTSRLSGLMNAYLEETGRQSVALPKEVPLPVPSAVVVPVHSSSEVVSDVPSEKVSDDQLEKLINLINQNDDLKDALLYRVDEVKEIAKNSEKWGALFKGVNIDDLSKNLQVMVAAKAKKSSEPDLDNISKVI